MVFLNVGWSFFVFQLVALCFTPRHVPLFVSSEEAGTTVCPPPGFDAIPELDFEGYIEARWYSIAQVPVSYQPIEQLYCVYVQYSKVRRPRSLLCRIFGCTDPITFEVFNSAREDSPTGREITVRFEGTITDGENYPARVFVGYPLIPRPLRRGSNYWIVAAGKFNDLVDTVPASDFVYDYALISGGPPSDVGTKTDDGCYNDSGMWLLSKVPFPPDGVMDAIGNVARGLGIAFDEFAMVQHENCEY